MSAIFEADEGKQAASVAATSFLRPAVALRAIMAPSMAQDERRNELLVEKERLIQEEADLVHRLVMHHFVSNSIQPRTSQLIELPSTSTQRERIAQLLWWFVGIST